MLVVEFRRLIEKSAVDADITEILDQLGQSEYFFCMEWLWSTTK